MSTVPTPQLLWGIPDKVWDLIKQIPLLGLLGLIAWRMPMIHDAISSGYEENAAQLEKIVLIQQRDYQQREQQRNLEIERLHRQLNAEMVRYQQLISRRLEETDERVQQVEEKVDPPPC